MELDNAVNGSNWFGFIKYTLLIGFSEGAASSREDTMIEFSETSSFRDSGYTKIAGGAYWHSEMPVCSSCYLAMADCAGT